jgi:hypothetical protein
MKAHTSQDSRYLTRYDVVTALGCSDGYINYAVSRGWLARSLSDTGYWQYSRESFDGLAKRFKKGIVVQAKRRKSTKGKGKERKEEQQVIQMKEAERLTEGELQIAQLNSALDFNNGLTFATEQYIARIKMYRPEAATVRLNLESGECTLELRRVDSFRVNLTAEATG